MAAHHDALIAIMVLTSAADNDMTDKELKKMGDVVGNWPDGISDEMLDGDAATEPPLDPFSKSQGHAA